MKKEVANPVKELFSDAHLVLRIKSKLPINKDGEPDWDFMEDYIKSLNYSNNL